MYSIYLCRCPITDQQEALEARRGGVRAGRGSGGWGGREGGREIKSGIALTSKLG